MFLLGVTKAIFSPRLHWIPLVAGTPRLEDGFPLELPAAPAVRSMAAWMAGLDFMLAHSSAGLCGRQLSGAYDGCLISLKGDQSSSSVKPLPPFSRTAAWLLGRQPLGAGRSVLPFAKKGEKKRKKKERKEGRKKKAVRVSVQLSNWPASTRPPSPHEKLASQNPSVSYHSSSHS